MDKPAHMYIFRFLRNKDLDKCEAVDEVPKITEKRRLGAPVHLGPLQSLQVKQEMNSLQIATSQKCDYYENTMIAAFKNVFFCGQKQDKEPGDSHNSRTQDASAGLD